MRSPSNFLEAIRGLAQPEAEAPLQAQQILAGRFRPTANDVGNAAMAGISNDSYVDPQMFADNRMKTAMSQIAAAAEMRKAARDPMAEAYAKQGRYINPQTGMVENLPGWVESENQRVVGKEQALNPVRAEGARLKAEATYPLDIQKRRAGAPIVNVNNAQESAFAKNFGKILADEYMSTQKAGQESINQTAKYQRLNQLLEGVQTGRFTGTAKEVKKAAKGIGINIEALGIPDDVSQLEAAEALSNQMALELRNPAGGAGMPGAMSDADRQYLQRMVPGIANTPEGRALMVETAQKLAKRNAEVAQLARNYRLKTGRFDDGFYNVLAEYSAQNPLFSDGNQSPQLPANRPPLENFMR